MHLPIRTTLAVIALALAAGTAQAAPALEPQFDTSLVIAVVDDSTSENDAVEIDQNTLPYSPGGSKSKPSAGASSSSSSDDGTPMENKEYDRETNQ
jgi:hypothetical protein